MTEIDCVLFGDEAHLHGFDYYLENFENTAIRFEKLLHDLQISKEGRVLENYLQEGGSLHDYCYSYYQNENGVSCTITIPVIIVSSGNMNALRTMIERDRSLVDYTDDEYPLISHAFIHEQFEIVDYLLAHGANPSVCGIHAKLPLYFAINAKHPKYVRKLLEHKADPNNTFSNGRINYLTHALMNARRLNKNLTKDSFELDEDHAHIIRLLIEADATLQESEVDETEKRIYWIVYNFYVIKNNKVYNCSKLLKCERDALGL